MDAPPNFLLENPSASFGPWLAGGLADFLLLGALIPLVARYYKLFPTDDRYHRVMVGLITFLAVVKSLQAFVITWMKFAAGWGNIAQAESGPWYQGTEAIFTEIIGFIVQLYFSLRVFRLLGRNWFVLAASMTMMLTSLGANMALTVMIARVHNIAAIANFGTLVTVSMVTVVASDVIITAAATWHLTRVKSGFHRTDTLINRILVLMWTTAAPPTMCALMILITYQTVASQTPVFMSFSLAMSKLYTISLIYTINSRASSFASPAGTQHSSSGGRVAGGAVWAATRSKNDYPLASRGRETTAPGFAVKVDTEAHIDISPDSIAKHDKWADESHFE